MPYETDFDAALTLLLGKARGATEASPAPGPGPGPAPGPSPVVTPKPATLNFQFGGGGAALSTASADPILVEIPWPGEIRWAHMYAGTLNATPTAVVATIDVSITRISAFDTLLPLYGANIPRLTGTSSADLSIATWITNLLPGDALIARLTSFSGDATWLSLNLLLYPTAVDLGSESVTDAGGDAFTDADGEAFVIRS